MSLGCNCPDVSPLPDVISDDCPVDIGQIQRFIFVKRGQVIFDSASGGGDGLSGVPQIDSQIDTKADWAALVAAVDDTKAVFSSKIGGDPLITAGEAVINGGGDNSTFNGEEEIAGKNPNKFTGLFKSLSPENEIALKNIINCRDIEVYLINEFNKIICNKHGAFTRNGFVVRAGFMGDRNNLGKNAKDTFAVQWTMPDNWSENMDIVTLEAGFNAIYDF